MKCQLRDMFTGKPASDNCPLCGIKRLPKHRGVKLSSTHEGQRELIREMRNKINELVDWINAHEEEA